jgi:hypothetical protein
MEKKKKNKQTKYWDKGCTQMFPQLELGGLRAFLHIYVLVAHMMY